MLIACFEALWSGKNTIFSGTRLGVLGLYQRLVSSYGTSCCQSPVTYPRCKDMHSLYSYYSVFRSCVLAFRLLALGMNLQIDFVLLSLARWLDTLQLILVDRSVAPWMWDTIRLQQTSAPPWTASVTHLLRVPYSMLTPTIRLICVAKK